MRLETGEVGRLAAGAIMAKQGESVVYSTACGDLWLDKEEVIEDLGTSYRPSHLDDARFHALGLEVVVSISKIKACLVQKQQKNSGALSDDEDDEKGH